MNLVTILKPARAFAIGGSTTEGTTGGASRGTTNTVENSWLKTQQILATPHLETHSNIPSATSQPGFGRRDHSHEFDHRKAHEALSSPADQDAACGGATAASATHQLTQVTVPPLWVTKSVAAGRARSRERGGGSTAARPAAHKNSRKRGLMNGRQEGPDPTRPGAVTGA